MWEDMSDDERRQPANLLSAVRLMVDSMLEDMNDGNVGRLESRWPIQKSSWHVSILTQCGKKATRRVKILPWVSEISKNYIFSDLLISSNFL